MVFLLFCRAVIDLHKSPTGSALEYNRNHILCCHYLTRIAWCKLGFTPSSFIICPWYEWLDLMASKNATRFLYFRLGSPLIRLYSRSPPLMTDVATTLACVFLSFFLSVCLTVLKTTPCTSDLMPLRGSQRHAIHADDGQELLPYTQSLGSNFEKTPLQPKG